MNLLKLLLYTSLVVLTSVPLCHSASLRLSWNANTETDLAGYRVYYGIASGDYGEPIDVGNVTAYELTGLSETITYYVALTAFDTADNESEKSDEVSGMPLSPDTQDPIVTITSPTASSTYATSNSTISIAGSSSDNVGVTQVTWSNSRGGSGSASGTASWSVTGISLQSGTNLITVTARDAAGNTGTDTLTVTYNPPVTSTTSSLPPSTTTTTATPTTSTTAPATTTTPVTTTIPGPTTTTIPSDITPPHGSITINNGALVTNSLNVVINLSVSDSENELLGSLMAAPSGQEANPSIIMSLSNDGRQWSALEPFTSTKLWTLEPGEGMKTVYAQFRDAAGNWMPEPAQTQIRYEASPNSCEEPQQFRPVAVEASSQLAPLFSKENAVDGNPSTTWSTLLSFFKRDEFITLYLGAVKRISWITMQAASTLFGTDFFPVNFTLEISSDNQTWEKIGTEQGYTPPIKSSRTDSWDFKSLECRYIRVYITEAKTTLLFFKMAQIAEIEVYGCNITDEPPLLAGDDSASAGDEGRKQEAGRQQPSVGQKELQEMLPTIPGKPVITRFK